MGWRHLLRATWTPGATLRLDRPAPAARCLGLSGADEKEEAPRRRGRRPPHARCSSPRHARRPPAPLRARDAPRGWAGAHTHAVPARRRRRRPGAPLPRRPLLRRRAVPAAPPSPRPRRRLRADQRRAGGRHPARAPGLAVRRNRLRSLGQGRVSEPWRQRERPGGRPHPRRCPVQRRAAPRRAGLRGQRRLDGRLARPRRSRPRPALLRQPPRRRCGGEGCDAAGAGGGGCGGEAGVHRPPGALRQRRAPPRGGRGGEPRPGRGAVR